MPNPTRHHVNAPVKAPASSTWLAGGGGGGAPRRSRASRGSNVPGPLPQVPTMSGARALPKFAGRCPSRSPTRGPGGRGA